MFSPQPPHPPLPPSTLSKVQYPIWAAGFSLHLTIFYIFPVSCCACASTCMCAWECKYATDACYCPWDKKRQRKEGKVQGLMWRRAGCPYKISMQIVDSVALRRLAVIVTCQVVLVKSFSVTRLIFHRRDLFWSKNLIRISACPCLRLRLQTSSAFHKNDINTSLKCSDETHCKSCK